MFGNTTKHNWDSKKWRPGFGQGEPVHDDSPRLKDTSSRCSCSVYCCCYLLSGPSFSQRPESLYNYNFHHSTLSQPIENESSQMLKTINEIKKEFEHFKRAAFDSSKVFLCPECGKTFRYEKWFKSHVKEHDKTKMHQWKCNICDEVLETKSTLKRHMKSHPQNRKFKCSECDQRFRLKHHLNHHKTIHNVSEEHTCKICGKQFGSYCSLKTHQKKALYCRSKCLGDMDT